MLASITARNVQLGRRDTRGATRLATAVGVVVAFASALGSSAGGAENWLFGAVSLASWVAFSALLSAAFFAAIEPHVVR